MPKHTQEFEFSLRDRIMVKEIQRPGIVELIQMDYVGIQYRITFWNDSKRETAWVYGDEIELRA